MNDREIRAIILVLLGVFLINCVACSNKDSKPATKELFSRWVMGDSVLDLTGGSFGTNPVSWAIAPNAGCSCTVDISGSQTGGTAYMTGCSHYGPTNYCPAGAVSFTYTNTNATLTLCDGSGPCEVYK